MAVEKSGQGEFSLGAGAVFQQLDGEVLHKFFERS
jgi:hypothetical protein